MALLQKSLPKLRILPARDFNIVIYHPQKRNIEIDCEPCHAPLFCLRFALALRHSRRI